MKQIFSVIALLAVFAMTSFALILQSEKRTITDTASVAKIVKTTSVEVVAVSPAFLTITQQTRNAGNSKQYTREAVIFENKLKVCPEIVIRA